MGGKGLPESVAWNAYKNWKDGQGELVRLTFTAESFFALGVAPAKPDTPSFARNG